MQRIQDIQSGKQRAPEDVLIKIVEIFNVNGTWLLTGEKPMYRHPPHQITPCTPAALASPPSVKEIDESLKKIKTRTKTGDFFTYVGNAEDEYYGGDVEKISRENGEKMGR